MPFLVKKTINEVDKYLSVIKLNDLEKIIFDSNPDFAETYEDAEDANISAVENNIDKFDVIHTNNLPLFFISVDNGKLIIDGLKDINGNHHSTIFINLAKHFSCKEQADNFAFKHNIQNYEVLSKTNS